jgi:hypothetical protein
MLLRTRGRPANSSIDEGDHRNRKPRLDALPASKAPKIRDQMRCRGANKPQSSTRQVRRDQAQLSALQEVRDKV